MKSYIFHNGQENISNNIMQGCPFPIMRAMKKVDPRRIQGWL
jgi:hypothetical protein